MPDSAISPKRVFIGPTEIAGYFGQLAIGLRNAGVDACFVPFVDHPFAYPVDERSFAIPRMLCWARRKRSGGLAVRLCKTLLRRLNFLLRLAFLIQALARFDAFVFGYGRTILGWKWPVDLWLLRKFGKRVILVYLGSDSRPPWLDIRCHESLEDVDAAALVLSTKERKQQIRRMEAHADIVVVNPLSAQLHEKRAVDWFRIGIPTRPVEEKAEAEDNINAVVRALHAPSNPLAKGTAEIRQAVRNLKAEGVPIELTEIQGQPNKVVIEALRRCDFVIDQCYTDTPMAGFACEAAALGRPAVVGGYELGLLAENLPKDLMPPSAICHPDAIEDMVHNLATDRHRRIKLGRQAQAFIRGHWHRDAVARRFVRLIDGDIPDDWWINPAECPYRFGGGAPEGHRRAIVRAMVAQFGSASMQIDDKPRLRDKIVRLALNGSDPNDCKTSRSSKSERG